MKFSTKLHTIKSGWSIVNIERSQFLISKTNVFFLRRLLLLKQTVMQHLSGSLLFAQSVHLGFLVFKEFGSLPFVAMGLHVILPSHIHLF